MGKAWRISPYNKFRNISVKQNEEASKNDREDIVENAMCFQPRSGFCGLATVNTVLRSLDKPMYVSYPDRGRGYSMYSLAEYIVQNCAPFVDVQAIFMNPNTTLEEFRSILRRYANSSEYRLLANFHRTPLFYSDGSSTWQRSKRRAWAGHWSPVGGMITDDDGVDYVLVLDTNSNYGPFMVKLERFYRAVKTQTFHDGYRGFIKVRIDPFMAESESTI
uniref:glutathione gamma-glutamylcysteinyltransferase n=1 Tax=Pseudictyota dubia TaxID=2749911 RepID=A0A7R9W5U8_9STRA